VKLAEVITEAAYKAPTVQPIQALNDLSRRYKFALVKDTDWDPNEKATADSMQRMMAPRKFVVYNKNDEEVGQFASFDEFLEKGTE